MYQGEKWLRSQGKGEYVDHIRGIWKSLLSHEVLSRIGLVTLPTRAQLDMHSGSHDVDEDRSVAAQTCAFVVALIRRRCLRGL